MRFHLWEALCSSVHAHKTTVDLLLIGLPIAAYHVLARYALSMMVESFAESDVCVRN